MADLPAGSMHIGEGIDPASHARTGEATVLPSADLVTHGVIVGMTGSGKTGLGVVMLEEVLGGGVPALILDPKGDLANLALTFPGLTGPEFQPWVDEGGAQRAGVAVDQYAEQVATQWRDGLTGWGIGPDRVRALHDGVRVAIYTPGSESGIPLNLIGSLRPPADLTDLESVRDEIEGYVSGVLGLVGITADPLSSREHILLANLIEQQWTAGQALDLASLVGMIPNPPVRKLGVFDVDTFFPPADRTKLALQLNGLLASPAFAAWAAGPPIDIDLLLRGSDGRPRAAIVSLAHLSDEERQLVVTLVLGKLVTWMRRQPGTADLRALVYFDEVLGFVPPTAAPPSKKPILTLLKQARAFGVGIVLATQNPVDLDYKAVANAGTWMVGRLQTENDKARLLEGMSAAAGGVDLKVLSDTISALDKREFVLRRAGSDAPSTFTTRWAMSYLRGPLTREQIATLMADAPERTAGDGLAWPAAPAVTEPGEAGAATPPGTPLSESTASAPAPAASPATTPAPSAPAGAGALGAPPVAPGVPVTWLDPAAPWAPGLGLVPTGTQFAPAVVARVSLLFDDEKADLREQQEWEAVLFPVPATVDPAAFVNVDHDPRDLRTEPPAGISYVGSEGPIGQKTFWAGMQKGLVEHLYRTRTVDVLRNADLKLWSRPGESAEQFAQRCDEAADAGADAAAAKLRDKYESRIARAQDALAASQDRAAEAETAAEARQRDEVVGGVGDLLGGLLGGRSNARTIARTIGGASGRRGRSSSASQRVESARNRAEDKATALTDLQAELEEDLSEIAAEWDAKVGAVETVSVPLEKTDIQVAQLALVWVPVA